jgi:hypothetical protein
MKARQGTCLQGTREDVGGNGESISCKRMDMTAPQLNPTLWSEDIHFLT